MSQETVIKRHEARIASLAAESAATTDGDSRSERHDPISTVVAPMVSKRQRKQGTTCDYEDSWLDRLSEVTAACCISESQLEVPGGKVPPPISCFSKRKVKN